MLSQWKARQLVPTQLGGFRVDLHGSTGPELCCPGGHRVAITDGLGQHQLLWKCKECQGGLQHYKLCTSKTLNKRSALWCAFCKYNVHEWRREHKRLLPDCELWFMALLVMAGLDQDYCLQMVVPQLGQQPIDFYNLQHGFAVQVDGRSHWEGMRGLTRDEALARDMQQNMAAFEAHAHLVRVHEGDIDSDACVLAALQAAAQGYCIVLTPAYADELYNLNGRQVCYWEALLALVTNCCYDKDEHDNYRFWTGNTPT